MPPYVISIASPSSLKTHTTILGLHIYENSVGSSILRGKREAAIGQDATLPSCR
jgi:hypothetical protein